MRVTKKIAAAAVAAVMFAAGMYAEDGRSIMQRVHDVKDPDYTHTLVKMDLIEANGSTETRILEEWGKSKNNLASAVMIFKSPASVKDTRFLQVENDGRDDDKWIYLPALRSTRRIASSEGSKSFMGTDATYDDMSTREVDADTHELLGDVSKNGFDCWQVKSTPVDKNDSQYLYRISCIDKKTLLPVSVDMYDKKGNLVKVLTVEKIQQLTGKNGAVYNIPTANLLKNVQTGHSTRMAITNIEVDKPVPDKVFTQNFLNTGRL